MTNEAKRIAALEQRIAELEGRFNDLPQFAPVTRSIHDIVVMAAQVWGVSVSDIYGPSRLAMFSEPRQAVMWVAKQSLPISLERIGDALGKRDHTTIMHGVRQADRLRERDHSYREVTDRMREAMNKISRRARDRLIELVQAEAPQLQAAE